jgi:SAM-dependent methyltransferase
MIETWSSGPADVGMPEDLLVDTMQSVLRHPWWKARARVALQTLRKHHVLPPSFVYDLGCGWGTNLTSLERAGYRAVGTDISRRILELIDLGDRRLIEMDITQSPSPGSETADAALALDVFEHIDDDRGAARNLSRLLKPGGLAVISVPALPELYSEFDEVQGHRRRYTKATLSAVFEQTDLKLHSIFWWGGWMVPVLRFTRQQSSKRATNRTYADYLRLPPWPAPQLLALAYAIERPFALAGKLKTGTSLFAVATRDGD